MAQIFQSFELDLEAIAKLSPEDRSGFAESGRTLCEKLLDQGYIVIGSSDAISGLPALILVSGERGKDPKRDFYATAGQLGLNLQYKSGQLFFADYPISFVVEIPIQQNFDPQSP